MAANLEVNGGIPTDNTARNIQDQTPTLSALAIGQNRVGIGTTTPTYKLTVTDSTNSAQAHFGYGKSTSDSQILIGNGITNDQLLFVGMNPVQGYAYLHTYGTAIGKGLVLKRTGVNGGSVGIGVTDPGAQLEIKSDSTSKVPLIVNTPASPAVDIARFQQNGSTKFVIDKDGQVGIGKDPTAGLSVAGGVQIENDTDLAGSSKAGTLRYRTSQSIGYLEVCVQTGVSTWTWKTIVHG